MRLIDADALIKDTWFVVIKGENIDDIAEQIIRQCKRIVSEAPTIDAVSVVYGEWRAKYEGPYLQRRMYCSVCGKKSGIGGIENNQRKPYCPNCGAKMDGERKESE